MEKFEAEEQKEEGETQSKRLNWANQLDYIMSIIGCIVGYGNLWRFPYICNRNGGGAFLIPFLFFLITCGLPLFFLEISIGQFAGKSPLHVWGVCPLLKGVGIGQWIVTAITVIYYQNILAWSLYYMGMSCSRILPWTTCSNIWNTDRCVDAALGSGGNVTPAFSSNYSSSNSSSVPKFSLSHTDVEEFWQYKALGISQGVHDMGRVQWHLALSLFVAWLIVFLCLIRGVRSVGKVVYVTALLPYVLLTALFIRTLMLPGAIDGVLYYLSPDFSRLLELQVWLEALVQVFYSLGPGWGVIVALSSYNNFKDNALRNSLIVTFAGEGTSLFSGLVIFTVLGFMAKRAEVGVADVASSGPGLGFVAYPEGLSELPLPQLWAFLFFVMMITIGLDSMFTWSECLITILLDQFPRQLRRRRVLVTAILCLVCFLLGIPFTTQGGIYYFQLVDWYTGCVSLILFGVLESVTYIWIYGAKNFGDDVELMLGRRVPLIFNILLGYVTPTFLCVAMFLILWQFQPPQYGHYSYPVGWQIAGWVFAMVSVIPVPIMAVVALCKAKGSFLERLKEATSPDETWKPAEAKYHQMYSTRNASRRGFSCIKPCTQ